MVLAWIAFLAVVNVFDVLILSGALPTLGQNHTLNFILLILIFQLLFGLLK
jgi:hypothetical protein